MSTEIRSQTSARLLEVRRVDVISGRGRSLTLSSVRCPARNRTAAVEECAECGTSDGIAQDPLGHGCVSCRAPTRARAGADAPTVSDAMRASALALRPGVTRGIAADALRSRGAPAAPVVDGAGHPIGLVAEADLLRSRTGAKVADVMARVALSVPEAAPLARAAALMAAQRVERLAVVSEDGVVVGVLTALDVLSWLAGAGGPLAADDLPGGF